MNPLINIKHALEKSRGITINLIPKGCEPFTSTDSGCTIKGFIDRSQGKMYIQEVFYEREDQNNSS